MSYYKFRGIQTQPTIADLDSACGLHADYEGWTAMAPKPAWVSDNGAYFFQGARMHGDSVPFWPGLADGMTEPTRNDPGGVLKRFWNCLNAWGVVWVGSTNTTTNAFCRIFDSQLYVLLRSTGQWTRVGNHNGRPAYTFTWWDLDNLIISTNGVAYHDRYGREGWSNVPAGNSGLGTAGDRNTASADTAKYRLLHGGLVPMVEVDGSDVIGVMVKAKASLFTINNEALNGVTSFGVQVGSDFKPELTSVLGEGELAGMTYVTGSGGGRQTILDTLNEVKDVYYITMKSSTASGNGQNGGYADFPYKVANGNDPWACLPSYETVAANLPVLRFNPAA
jgi:hypothetical protein